ncbi:MAG: pyridoxal phosphate-dependent aminotransferase, partial [Mycobacteriaceae bacterium]|nr:pyridoxal phosphate-dependent aminotransferase [Mycobacteriaceae bacterium]
MRLSKLAKRLSESQLQSPRSKKPDGVIDLSSGSPEIDTPTSLKDLATEAIRSGHNQYAHPWGDFRLRELLADQAKRQTGFAPDPDAHITVTAGTSSALSITLLSILEPDSQVIVLEPYFEGTISAIRLAGGEERLVSLAFDGNSWQINWRALNRAFNRKTRAIIINTPHNPTGAMLSRSDLDRLLDLCGKW